MQEWKNKKKIEAKKGRKDEQERKAEKNKKLMSSEFRIIWFVT